MSSAITRGLGAKSSRQRRGSADEAGRWNVARGLVGYFGTTAVPRRSRLGFHTLRRRRQIEASLVLPLLLSLVLLVVPVEQLADGLSS